MGSKPLLSRCRVAALAVCASLAACLAGSPAGATVSMLSTLNGATLGGVTFRDGDIVSYDDVTNTSTLVFNEDNFAANENVDALDVLANGHLLFSTVTGATLGGLAFRDGDVVDYNPVSNTATLFFNEDLFLTNANIDALAVLDNGFLVISTALSNTLAGVSFLDGDLVLYDPVGLTASILLSESLFSADEDIDGVDVLGDGSIILSTQNGATIGGLTFRDGDLVRYNPLTGTASLWFSESNFSAGENVDAVFVPAPEPGTGSLLALGLVLIAARRRRQV